MWTIQIQHVDPVAKTKRWLTYKKHTAVAEFETFGALKRFVKSHALRLYGNLRAYENVRHEYRTLSLALLLVFAAGCTVVYPPNGPKYRTMATRHLVVNNTVHLLDVSVDGLTLTTLHPGQSLNVLPHWLVPKTLVVVVAHDSAGHYYGTDTWTFLSATPEVWVVDSLRKPLTPQ